MSATTSPTAVAKQSSGISRSSVDHYLPGHQGQGHFSLYSPVSASYLQGAVRQPKRRRASCGEWTISLVLSPAQDFDPRRYPMLPFIAALMHACSLAALPAQAPERPVTVIRVTATVDTALCPATRLPRRARPFAPRRRGRRLCRGWHLLIRFEKLPEVPTRDIVQVRLKLYRK